MTGSVTHNGGLVYDVRFVVAGLATGDTARLEIDLTWAAAVGDLDPRCVRQQGSVTCEVTAADSSPIDLLVIGLPGVSVVTANLVPGVDDPDAGNNTWRAVLD
ncbi:hypothetical protein NOCA1210001 [metagenome]|uniref:Uncharacterized protein n=1 Tax=metagenome TaxID=256318 RepID=A0A2P2CE69_9ZZZZ